jgi:hypothetical protein
MYSITSILYWGRRVMYIYLLVGYISICSIGLGWYLHKAVRGGKNGIR